MREIAGFFIFVVLILSALILVWFGVRSYALSQPVSTYQTELVKLIAKKAENQPLIFEESHPEYPLSSISFSEGQWKTSSGANLSSLTLESNELTLLFFSGKDSQALPQLREFLKKSDRWKNTILCSRFDGLLKDLRDLEPEWTFCSGEIYMTRLLAFSSLGLESLLNIDADVVFIHQTNATLSTGEINAIIQEARRQNKVVLIGPVESKEKTRQWAGENPHGWMVQTRDQKVQ